MSDRKEYHALIVELEEGLCLFYVDNINPPKKFVMDENGDFKFKGEWPGDQIKYESIND